MRLRRRSAKQHRAPRGAASQPLIRADDGLRERRIFQSAPPIAIFALFFYAATSRRSDDACNLTLIECHRHRRRHPEWRPRNRPRLTAAYSCSAPPRQPHGNTLRRAGRRRLPQLRFKPRRRGAQWHALLGHLFGFSDTEESCKSGHSPWYLETAKGGSREARRPWESSYQIGSSGYERDPAKAAEWFTKASEQGSAFAATKLGRQLLAGEGRAAR